MVDLLGNDAVPPAPKESARETSSVTVAATASAPTTTDSGTTSSPTSVTETPSAPALVVNNVAASAATQAAVGDYNSITDQLLSQIGDVGVHSNFKCMLYGPPGSAKSSWLGEIPNNLVYDFEDGMIAARTASVNSGRSMAPNVKAIPFTSLEQADELIDRLQKGHPAFDAWRVFSVDTVSTMHKKMLEFIMRREKAKRPSMNEYDPQTEHYTEVNEILTRFVQGLCDIKDRDIVVLAHAQTVEPKGKQARTYIDFSEKLSNKLAAKMDIVSYVQMLEMDDGNGGKRPFPVHRVVSEGTIMCKTRIPLPAEIKDPTWLQYKQEFENAKSLGTLSDV